MYDPLGLSIGTTNLVAACNGTTVTRRAVLTLYPHCAPKIGVFDQKPDLTEPGTLMSGFVERIGDSVALVSPDGSVHDPDLLLVEALDAMVLASGADASSSEISIAVPAHWKSEAVQALRNGLRTHVGFVRSGMAPRLVSDAIAALTAVDSEFGLPDGGVVGLLDFGGSATCVTLVQTASGSRTLGFEPVSATVRYEDFSGNQIDQALLLRVIDELGHDLDAASTAAVGQLGHLKERCRAAKERLSTDAVTEFAAEFSGCSSSIEVTRERFEDLIQDQLTGFIYAFDDMLARNNSSWADLAAVVAVGGGANIPLVTQRLSFHTRRPVLTAPQPECAAAMGALQLASRGGDRDSRTRTSIGLVATAASGTSVIELPAGDVMVIDHDALTDRELAWSQTEFPGDVPVPLEGDPYNEDGPCWSMRLNAIEPPKEPPWRRIRLSQLLIGVSAVVAMTAIGGVAFTLTAIEERPAPSRAPVVPSLAPRLPSTRAPSPPSPPAPVPSPAPAPTTVAPPPPPPTQVVTTTPPPPVTTKTTPPTTTSPPTTTTTSTPPSTTTTTTPPTTTPTTTTTEPPMTTAPTVKMTTEWLHVPLLPVPIPVPVPQRPGAGEPQNPFQRADGP
ncbi:Hsp70 family protein [Mycobacterium decipiens]|uniref:Molecular chaperone n=1 Tax=Mycobacterium decipiens TaxID=1430326 RepID=A0A1X2LP24_9MYCO|nr:Hsp70 family protein [Mycobacterium decipiens]OSC36508.1 hypothetical protein B8W66_22830 [Mycobacterium decipiens]